MTQADDLEHHARTAVEFGQWLRRLREAKGLSARQLDAQTSSSESLVHLSKSQISRVESGQLPDLTWLRAFLNENGVSTGSRLYRRVERLRNQLDRDGPGNPATAEILVSELGLDQLAYLNEKRMGFTGRGWLFAEVNAWLRRNQSEYALLITGDPGVGKSAFVAEYVHRNSGDRVVAYHCCTRRDRRTLEAGAFVLNLVAMLGRRLPGYKAKLAGSTAVRALESAQDYPGRALDEAIIAPLRQLDCSAERPYVLVVDALDEATLHLKSDLLTDDASIVGLLATLSDRMPAWLRIIATARRDQRVAEELSDARTIVLEAHSRANNADLAEYVNAKIAVSLPVTHQENMAREVLSAAEGNFLYAKLLLRDVQRGLLTVRDVNTTPRGMFGFYAKAFRSLFPTTAATTAARPTLEVLVAAQSPLDFDLAAKAAGGDRYQVADTLNQLSPLVSQRDKGYVFHHSSLVDWLTDPTSALYVDSKRGHARLAGECVAMLSVDPRTAHIGDTSESMMAYFGRYGLDHLAQAGMHVSPRWNPWIFADMFLAADRTIHGFGDETSYLPVFVRQYVAHNASVGAFGALSDLIRLLALSARSRFHEAGVIRVEIMADGTSVSTILGRGNDTKRLNDALSLSVWVGSVIRAVVETWPNAVSEMASAARAANVAGLAYLARGLDVAVWTDDAVVAERGYFLGLELDRLTSLA